ncbi:MAG TPA: EAL domain-containing protein [Oxalicibacterium sp.]|uniref:putative bifunctional diguanylate cyclase/phosphodiesterase n=1 Tax=Oxalicibacterium sp. TaxID=2766525 RepID=UPI002CD57C7C|nr:EAL domain-containing protein [Oxalicibacterium sp.]HWU98486.1 EAL domain-containing protein [Oxalicibacterium sp.]
MQNRQQPNELGKKSAKASLLTISVALIFASILLVSYQFVSLRNAIIEDVTVQSRIIAENTVAAVMFNDEKAGDEILGSLRASPAVCSAVIFNAHGKLLAEYLHHGQHMDNPDAELLQQGYVIDTHHLTVAQNVMADGEVVGTVSVRVDLDQMYERLLTSALITLSIVIASLGFAYLLVTRMRRVVSETEAHLTYLAHVDSVTGLPNRHAFNEHLAYALPKIKRFGGSIELLLLDLDNFKVVNDTLGHNNGDQLLKAVADRLTTTLRDTDVIARIGGDEFAVILESRYPKARGARVATKIVSALSAPYIVGQHEIYVTGSVGIASYPADGVDLPTLTRNADTAMYQAKARGKNTFAEFEQAMDHNAQKRLLLENNLRRALERDGLSLHYQPKLNLKDGNVTGFEALLRWTDPELGVISPAEFIPVAEECGLIVQIGHWVLNTACRDMAALRELGLGRVKVAVNLSVRQTRSERLLSDILALLQEWHVLPEQLGLEITESVLMENIESNVSLLNQLRAHGIRLSIDDFGTGYSSMAYLKRFHIDELKIDRAFVKDIPGDGEDEAIVTAILALAHSLGLSVVAEGVETAEQQAFLHSAGCEQIQGYHFARPMPVQDIPAFLASLSSREVLPA